MSARMFYLPRRPTLPDASEIKASLLFWGSYILLLSCYCSLYQMIVDATKPDLFGSFVHVCRNWAVWILTTPVVFQALRRYSTQHSDRPRDHLRLGTVIIAVSVAVPVAIDLLTQERNAATSLMIFLPRYIATMLILYMIWHTFVRRQPEKPQAIDASTAASSSEIEQPQVQRPALANLLVSKDADECLIHIDSVESLSAAGNYVEIFANGQCYLLRAPLKQVEDLLPAESFLRIHRSHIVKRDAITRIKTQPSGNGTVELRTGRALPMSKKHKSELQRFRVTFD